MVDEAEDGADAIEKLRIHGGAGLDKAFDAILMDFVMPVMVRRAPGPLAVIDVYPLPLTLRAPLCRHARLP